MQQLNQTANQNAANDPAVLAELGVLVEEIKQNVNRVTDNTFGDKIGISSILPKRIYSWSLGSINTSLMATCAGAVAAYNTDAATSSGRAAMKNVQQAVV